MEGTAEVNETMENSSEALHLKMKENNELHSQTDCVVLQNPTSVISKDTGWTEHFSSTRSTEMLLETLAAKDPHNDLVSPSVSEPSTTSCPSSFSGAIVEELTLRDVNFPNLGSSGSVEASPVRKGLWHNLTGIACGSRKDLVLKDFSRAEDRGKVAASFLSQSLAKRNLQFMQLGSNDLKASHDVVEGDGRQDLLRDIFVHHPLINRNKAIHSSGFQQFLLKSTLNGKSIAYSPQQTDNDTGLVCQSQDNMGIDECNKKTSVSMHSSIVKQNKKVLLDGGWFCTGSNVKHNGIFLRNWLKQKHHRSYKFERLQMFKQILELVDTSHSQGNALENLKPSFFVVNSSGIVKYVGSVSTQVPTGNLMYSASHQSFALEPQLKRKRFLKYDTKFQDTLSHEPINSGCGQNLHENFSSKHQRQDEKNKTVVQLHKCQLSSIEEVYDDDSRTISFDRGYSEQIQLVDSHQSSKLTEHQNLYNTCFQELVSEISSLEDRWYAGPENLYGNACTLSSNIYSLGILFFELFCSFESEESQFLAMSNLQHRILPPSFLAECPKEAGFCLWLLHPDPSSRPKSREILSNSLIFECYNVSSINQSLASIDDTDEETDLLLHFLSSLKNQKENQAAKLAADIQCLEKDVMEVEKIHLSRVESLYNSRDVLANSNDNSATHLHEVIVQNRAMSSWSVSSVNEERMMKNIDQLKHAYFSMRSSVKFSETNVSTRSDVGILKIRDNFNQLQCPAGRKEEESTDCLGAFFEGLCKYARYNEFEVRGCIRNVDILNSANVICSLSFDRDEDYFATAGVSKKIKIFEFGALLSDSVDVHYPLIEMSSRSKLSCVCWNNYIKNYLASTDYDGVVQLWDVSIGQGFAQYAEHEKRAWSVDFSPVDPTKLASGSDDCSVKLWSIKERNCVDTVRNVANVCCVQFSPHSSHLLAFGSADYKIYCYDLRNTRTPWCCLPGHGKAVSYVKFVDSETIVSASTDNTLKLWDLNKSSTCGMSTNACSLTFTGHTNEKNFVGLTVFDGYIACGSETNEVYVYHKSLPMPITAHKFGSIDPVSGQETGDVNGQFVSSVCWRTKSSMVVAANSSGSLKLLQLV